MSFMTKYGSIWSLLPQTTGRYFFVAPSAAYTVEGISHTASNDNDGLSPERALRTIDYAIGLTAANVGDVVVLLPGSHTQSSGTITLDVAGIVLTGIPGSIPLGRSFRNAGPKRLRTRLANTASAGIILTVDAANVEVCHLDLAPVTTGAGVSLQDGASDFYIHDCSIELIGTVSTSTRGIDVPLATANLDDIVISNCYFQSGTTSVSGANGPAINLLATVVGATIENCTFALKGPAAWADVILASGTATSGVLIRDCDFVTPSVATTVMTDAIDVTGSVIDGAVTVLRCYFTEGTDAFQATATLDIVVASCWSANSTVGIVTGSV